MSGAIRFDQAPAAAFAPALDVVPASNGTDIYLAVAGADDIGETLFANVTIGPGGDKGSYTLTYSPTTQLHVVTVAGFDSNVGTTGTIDITGTNGLATPIVSYNRARIRPADTNTIFSTDGRLGLAPVSPDTFSVVTYMMIVPDFAPRAPAPPGYRLIGQTYRVRASGNNPTSARPMFLDMSFTEADLAGADPHSLGLFGWDEAGQHWEDLGGQLLYDAQRNRQSIGVATSNFTSYALMATPGWYDEFDDLDLSGLSEHSNLAIGPLGDNLALMLESTPGQGSAVSLPISPTTTFAGWDRVSFGGLYAVAKTSLIVDVLSITGTVLLENVADGASLAGIDPARYPVLRLRARLASTDAGATPALDWWRLTWRPEADEPHFMLYLPLVTR